MGTLKRAVRALESRLHSLRRARRLRSSNRRVFIDCGANTCEVLRDKIRELPGFEFYAFEAQPELASEGQKVIEEHPDTTITFYNKAVWTRNGTIDFYLATEWAINYRGSSTVLEVHLHNVAKVDYTRSVKVQAIDFSEWLGDNFRADDYVILKMDIEGAEYDVLEKIIADNHHSIIDEVIVEFHYKMNDSISKSRHDALVAKIRNFARLEKWH